MARAASPGHNNSKLKPLLRTRFASADGTAVAPRNCNATSVYPKIAQFKNVDAFRARLAELGCELPLDDSVLTAAEGSPLAEPLEIGGVRVGNRW